MRSTPMLEPHRRFILVAREKDLSKAEQKLLDKLRRVNESIHTAMLLVEYFHKALDKVSVTSFRKTLTTWYRVVWESKLEPFLKLAKTIRKYRKNIEAYIQSSLTTAAAEGLNNKIKVLKRMDYGYSTPSHFSGRSFSAVAISILMKIWSCFYEWVVRLMRSALANVVWQ
jgi:transposase